MIEQFNGEYDWLSNFYRFEEPMKYKNGDSYLYFITNEHFYVAMKTTDTKTRELIANMTEKGCLGKVKKFGRTLTLRDDWESIKEDVMLHGLKYKFSKHNPILRKKLIDTGVQDIQEGNWWGDKYWGVCALRLGRGLIG